MVGLVRARAGEHRSPCSRNPFTASNPRHTVLSQWVLCSGQFTRTEVRTTAECSECSLSQFNFLLDTFWRNLICHGNIPGSQTSAMGNPRAPQTCSFGQRVVYRSGPAARLVFYHRPVVGRSALATGRVSQLHLELDSPRWPLLSFLWHVFRSAELPFTVWEDGGSPPTRPVQAGNS